MDMDREWGPVVVVAVGGSLLALATIHHVMEMQELGVVLPPLAALLTSGGLSAGILYGGYRLGRSQLDGNEKMTVAQWTVVGSLGGAVLTGVTLVVRTFEGRTLAEPAFPLLVYTSGGGLLALLAGYFSVRSELLRRRYEGVFNNTYQFTGILTPGGTLVDANDAALSFANSDREEFIGQKLWETDLVNSRPEARRTVRAGVEQGQEGEFFKTQMRIDGDVREAIVDFSIRPLHDEAGDVELLIAEGRDITRLEQHREHLSVLHRYLRHNLRNDLSIIEGHAEALSERVKGNGHTQHTDAIMDTVDDLSASTELVNEFLKRPASDGTTVDGSSLSEAVETACDQAPIDETRVHQDGDLDTAVRTDERFSLVLSEFFTAVSEYLTQGGEVRVDVRTTEEAVTLDTECVGIEIPDQELSAFDDVEHRSSVYHPTGMRFWYTKSIIESYGGTVEYQRLDADCVRIQLLLPRTTDESASAAVSATA